MIEILITLPLIIFSLCAFLFYINTHPYRDETEILPTKHNTEFEDVTIKTDDSINISGWFLFSNKKNNNKTPAIIVCHGLGTNRSDLIELSCFLSNNGFHVLTFDFRGHGKSEGNIVSLGYLEQKDIKATIDYIVSRVDVDAKKVGFFGLSMGASTGIQAISKDKRIQAIVSDSAYTSLFAQAKHEISKGYHLPSFPIVNILNIFYNIVFKNDMRQVSPKVKVSEISPRPILFIAGDKDERITVDDAKELFNQTKGPKELFIVKGATHGENLNVGGDLYKKKVLEFFKNYLVTQDSPPVLRTKGVRIGSERGGKPV